MSREYNEYLSEHRRNVRRALNWLVHNDIVDTEMLGAFNIHDESKDSEAEYGPYDRYFYGSGAQEEFDYAWLHHIHNNPHHWQYWLLHEDDGDVKALDMPEKYLIEMICDWWSFSFKSGNLYEIFDWYKEHKDSMILSKNTRKLVETYLDDLRFALDAYTENEKNQESDEN